MKPIWEEKQVFRPLKSMIAGKYLKTKKIKDLGQKLREECEKNNLKENGGFTIMFSEEEGRTILYVKDMPIESTGGMKGIYDKRSQFFNPEYKNIEWPYTGFVQGNIMGWDPISEVRIVEWLETYGYDINYFIQKFEYKPT